MKHVLIQNIRSIDELHVDIEKDITIIAGMNGTGKTTVLEAIENSLMMKGFAKEAIQKGKNEGRVTYVNESKGERQQVDMVVNQASTLVNMTITDSTGKVRAIKEVGEARRILGNYVNFTPQDLVTMTQTAEGRKKFLLDVLFKSLPNETKARLLLLENQISSKKNKDTQGNLYQQRTVIQSEISAYEKTLQNLPELTEEEEELLLNIEAIRKRRQEIHEELSKERALNSLYDDVSSYIRGKTDKIAIIPSWLASIVEVLGKVKIDVTKENDLVERIAKADQHLSNIAVYNSRKSSRENILKSLTTQREALTEINKQIQKNKDEIAVIYQQADLPSGIRIVTNDDENIDFYVSNGKQDLSISQLSESQLHYVIIVLLMHISTAEMVNIGNINVYDWKTLEKIVSLAKEYDRILLAEQVTKSEDLQIEIV